MLKDIVEKSEIYYDPSNDLFETEIDDDKEMLSIYKEFIDLNENTDECEASPWIIRFTFQKKMMEKSIIMEDIYLSLMAYDSEQIALYFQMIILKNL